MTTQAMEKEFKPEPHPDHWNIVLTGADGRSHYVWLNSFEAAIDYFTKNLGFWHGTMTIEPPAFKG